MSDKEFKPYVPADSQMREFTWRALILGSRSHAYFKWAISL